MVTERSPGPTDNELPCIWVLAGVLNYRICDRGYDCERCDLFQALSGSVQSDGPPTWLEEQLNGYVSRLFTGCRLYFDRPYRPPAFWLLPGEDGEVTVGLDGHLARMLAPIRDIVTPGVGVRLDRDQPCGWIARDGSAVHLRMPFAGRICAKNSQWIYRGGESDGPDTHEWILRITPERPLAETPGLILGEGVLAWYLDRIRILKRYLGEAIRPQPAASLGTIMADGGVPETCLEEVVGSDAFERLVGEVMA